MEFKFDEFEMLENPSNEITGENSYLIISKKPDIEAKSLSDIIQFIDEDGTEMDCTIDKFIEIFDNQGLSGFIL